MYLPISVFSAFAFIGFLMVITPLPWHLRVWNVGTCLYMLWIGSGCFIWFVNSIIWNGNMINSAPVWCDIVTRVQLGINIATPAAGLCINRRLYYAASGVPMITKSEKRRVIMADLSISLGLPLLGIVLAYIPQGHRFDIFEDFGCAPHIYYTPFAVVIISLPPIVIGLVSAFYGVRSILAFNKNRIHSKQISKISQLPSSYTGLTTTRYWQLMCLSGVDIMCTTPLAIFILVNNLHYLVPWKGWEDTHSNFSRVLQIPSFFWQNSAYSARGLEITRWSSVICAFVFFAFFGFCEDARKNYRTAWHFVLKRLWPWSTPVDTALPPPNRLDFPNTPSQSAINPPSSLFSFLKRKKEDSERPKPRIPRLPPLLPSVSSDVIDINADWKQANEKVDYAFSTLSSNASFESATSLPELISLQAALVKPERTAKHPLRFLPSLPLRKAGSGRCD